MPSNAQVTKLVVPMVVQGDSAETYLSIKQGEEVYLRGEEITRLGSPANSVITDEGSGQITINASGQDYVFNGSGLSVLGIQVLTTQQPAVANATLLLSSVQSQLNAALAALRAHGLLAT